MSRQGQTHRHRPRKAIAVLAALSIGAASLAGCGSNAQESAPQVTVTPSATPDKSAVPEPVLPSAWPLTGVGDSEIEARPAVAIKVENTAAARPQFGLEQADVVWETVVEFAVSRYIAVFHSKYPEEVGPVRSVRPMDMAVVAPLNGVFVYSGGQKGILALARNEPQIQAMDENNGGAALWRSPERYAPHNLHANVATFASLANENHSAPPQEQFVFAENLESASAAGSGTAATNIDLFLSGAARPQWSWDASVQRWMRSEGTTPAMVASGEQISATNVVMIKARHYDSGFDAQNKAPVPTYELVGKGEAVIATGGKTIEATWTKADTNSPMLLVDAQGEPLTLAPGNTWVELVPLAEGRITIS